MITHLVEGEKAPDFQCFDANSKIVKLEDFKGKKIVLFFYPADDTPTCTTESCNLRDNYHSFTSNEYEVIGVSPDSPKSHKKFIKKYKLPYILLADEDLTMAKNYGVWGEKMLFGKKYMGILRTTFIIDENGRIEKIISQVKAKEHTAQILTK